MLFPLMKLALGKQGAKMQVFSKGSEKAKAFLMDKIPLESLPTKFGGTNVEAQRVSLLLLIDWYLFDTSYFITNQNEQILILYFFLIL